MVFYSKVIGSGSYLPSRVLTNDAIAKFIDTSNEWIKKRTGILQRHITATNETTSTMAIKAGKNAINDAKVLPETIDVIIVATTTPDKTFPSCANIVQHQLKCTNAFAFDIQAVCCGFVHAMSIADDMIKSGRSNTVLVIGADNMTKIIDWEDRSTCILFGDGAGAFIMQKSSEAGVISSKLYSDGSLEKHLYTNGGVASSQSSGYIKMDGKAVFQHAIVKMSDSIIEIIRSQSLKLEQIAHIIPHQANYRIIESIAKKLGVDMQKMIVTIDKHANTSAGSIPLAFDSAVKDGTIKSGELVVFAAIGGGMNWGSLVMRTQ